MAISGGKMKYIELDYIENSGNQYINTGIYPSSTSYKAEIQYQCTRTTAPGSNQEAWAFAIWNDNSGWRCGCSGTSLNNVGTGFTFDNTLSTDKTIATSNACTATSSSYQVVLFGQGESGGPKHVSDSLFRIYYCKIWNGDELVRDFIPCEYEGKVGLWDKVTNAFFGNSGTGTFISKKTIKFLKINEFLQPKINGKKVFVFNNTQTHYNFDFNSFYTIIDYIEGTGTQWIDTKIIPVNANYKAEICYQSTKIATSSSESFIFGYWLESGQSGGWRAGIAKNTLTNTGVGFTFDNTVATKKTIATSAGATAYNSSQSPYLFSQNYKNTANTVADGQYRLYYCKMWNGDTLVRDFIPVIRNVDNKIGLYDKTTKQFFTNQGTGEFLGGGIAVNYNVLNYIELTGTQYINTTIAYLQGATQYGFYLDFEPAEVNFLGNSIYSVSSGNSATESSINASGLLYYKYGSNQRNISTLTKNNRYVYEVDHRDRTLKITLNGNSKSYDQILANWGEPLYLGYRKGGGYGKFKIYEFKIYKADVLVQHLIPVQRKIDKEIGMYDKVTNTFFSNAGTGTFIGG